MDMIHSITIVAHWQDMLVTVVLLYYSRYRPQVVQRSLQVLISAWAHQTAIAQQVLFDIDCVALCFILHYVGRIQWNA